MKTGSFARNECSLIILNEAEWSLCVYATTEQNICLNIFSHFIRLYYFSVLRVALNFLQWKDQEQKVLHAPLVLFSLQVGSRCMQERSPADSRRKKRWELARFGVSLHVFFSLPTFLSEILATIFFSPQSFCYPTADRFFIYYSTTLFSFVVRFCSKSLNSVLVLNVFLFFIFTTQQPTL